MKYCPINYAPLLAHETYSKRGLKLLSPRLNRLLPLEFSAEEQRAEALARAGKMSIQGLQPKLSAKLNVTQGKFELVDSFGEYLLKLPSNNYPQLPENEALTMTLAQQIGLQVPVHGLIYGKDNSMTYFIKRFDKNKKIKYGVEDFAQLSESARETKYSSSMEKVAKIITTHTSFPKIELLKLFKLTLFNYLIGNEDMHLKNFSLITIKNQISIAPHYDLLNTTIAQKNVREEVALPINGKKNNLTYKDFIFYFAEKTLAINEYSIQTILMQIKQAIPLWITLIDRSFLSYEQKENYKNIIEQRRLKLNINYE